MESQHLTYFKVENFKKFDSLEVKDIGQFNLIVGDNNVGKTCLLEALLFNKDNRIFKKNIVETLRRRGLVYFEKKKDQVISLTKDLTENSLKNKLLKNPSLGIAIFRSKKKIGEDKNVIIRGSSYNDKYFDLDTIDLLINENLKLDSFWDFQDYIPTIPLISFNLVFEEDIYDLYNNLKTRTDKENLINTLQVINKNILDVELRQNFDDLENVFILSFNDKDEFVPVNYLGDGFKRIFYIALKVLSLKGQRIMIDEIETGIHYSRQQDFWINILKICNELDVQIFATTHSNECIQAFYKASKELNEQKDIRLISLQEGEQKKIYSTTYNFENIEAGLYSNIELRA